VRNTGLTAAQFALLSALGGFFQCPANQRGVCSRQHRIEGRIGHGFVGQCSRRASGAVASVDTGHVDQRIGIIPSGTIITECAENNDPYFCAFINRAPGLGVLFGVGNIDQRNINTGSLSTPVST
jgi:hypothetical protein